MPLSFTSFRTLTVALACVAGNAVAAQPQESGPQSAANLQSQAPAELAQRLQALVQAEIAAGKLPGAVVLVGHRGRVVYRQAMGQRAIVPQAEAMTPDTVFDVASLTKVVATATATMMLVERGELRLADTVGRWIPELQQEAAKRVTVLQLLTHVAGYAPDFDLKQAWTGREGMLRALASKAWPMPLGRSLCTPTSGSSCWAKSLNGSVAAGSISSLPKRSPPLWACATVRFGAWTLQAWLRMKRPWLAWRPPSAFVASRATWVRAFRALRRRTAHVTRAGARPHGAPHVGCGRTRGPVLNR